MLLNDLSPTLANIVGDIVDNLEGKSECLNITALFTSKKQPDLNVFVSKYIKSLTIEQNFLTNYTDKIILHIQVTEAQYVVLYNSRKDLQCKLEFSTFDTRLSEVLLDKPYLSKIYKAIMITNADIYKSIPAHKLEPLPENREEKDIDRKYFDVDIELVSNVVFEMRKKRFNFILTKTTMADALKYTTNLLGLSKASIVTPDNKSIYTNFLVPPNKDITSIMKYYQNAPGYGVYNSGFCFYVTDDTMFVYPRFGRPLNYRPVNVYNVGQRNLEGMDTFGYQGMTAYELLCNTEVKEKNYSDLGSENEITAINTQLNETLIEGMKLNKQDELYAVIPNIANHFVKPSDPVSSDTFNMDFKPTHANSFALKSQLLRYQAIVMTFEWKSAHPFTFTPSTLVRYHYDDRFGYATKDCTCESVTYTFEPMEGSRLYPGFGCTAAIALNAMTV